MGYRRSERSNKSKIIKIFSIWQYDEKETYDPSSKQGGMFTGYINKFLKMKTEASGFPSHVVTDEHKRAFVANYELHEGIKLNIDTIKPNTGMKAINSLSQNSSSIVYGVDLDLIRIRHIKN